MSLLFLDKKKKKLFPTSGCISNFPLENEN
jgi:hypothetical protein